MAATHTTAPRPDSGRLSRRNLIRALPLVGLAAALPAMAQDEDPVQEDNPITSLPFVRDTTQAERRAGMPPRIFWDVKPSGDYTRDCETGKRYAGLALEYMVAERFEPLLGWAVFDMMRTGPDFSGIEVGFLMAFGRYAVTAQKRCHLARTGELA